MGLREYTIDMTATTLENGLITVSTIDIRSNFPSILPSVNLEFDQDIHNTSHSVPCSVFAFGDYVNFHT